MRSSRIKVLAFSCLLAALQAHAETYYVSPTGSAAWAQCAAGTGGTATPCNGRTAVENAVAGDLVYFRAGTYNPAANPVASWSSASNSLKYEHLPWNPSNSGTSTNPITFKAYPGETPVFQDNIYGGTIGVVGRSWIIWDGFTGTIVDVPNEVIAYAYFQDASNCVIRNSNFSGVLKNTHQNAALIFMLNNSNILIENNRLHDMNDDGVAGGEEAVNAAAILSFNTTGMVVKNNDIYNNYLGIWDKDTEQNNLYYQNHIWGGASASSRCQVGIQIRQALSEFGPASNPQAYQNVIRNCNIGVWVSYDDTAIASAKVYNNVIFYDSSYTNSDIGIWVSPGSTSAEVYNNIMDGYSVPLRYYAPATTLVAYSNQNSFFNDSSMSWQTGFNSPSYSPLSAWTTATGFDGNSILTNPMFVNAGGTTPSDYKLATGSPALGTGRNGLNIGAYPALTSPSIGSSLIRPKSPVLLP
jgi:hypothetical protein